MLPLAMRWTRSKSIAGLFWDAMLWATAGQSSCTAKLSEDMQNYRRLGGVEFINPFAMAGAPRIEALLEAELPPGRIYSSRRTQPAGYNKPRYLDVIRSGPDFRNHGYPVYRSTSTPTGQ